MILLPPPPHFLMFTLPLLVQISSPVFFFFSFWAHGCVFRFLISSRGLKFCNFLDFKLSLYSFYLRYRIIFLLWSSHLPLVFYALYSLSLFFLVLFWFWLKLVFFLNATHLLEEIFVFSLAQPFCDYNVEDEPKGKLNIKWIYFIKINFNAKI